MQFYDFNFLGADERKRQKEPIVCPLCRAQWIDIPLVNSLVGIKIPQIITSPPLVDQNTQTTATLQRRRSQVVKIPARENLQRSTSIDAGLGVRPTAVKHGTRPPESYTSGCRSSGLPISRSRGELRSNKNIHHVDGEYEDVVLPHAEPIPLEHVQQAQSWIKVIKKPAFLKHEIDGRASPLF